MLETVSNIMGLEIYTPDGLFVGVVDEVIIDLTTMNASGLYVDVANPVLVDQGVSISIPFSWVRGIGDAVILRTFPARISAGAPQEDGPR